MQSVAMMSVKSIAQTLKSITVKELFRHHPQLKTEMKKPPQIMFRDGFVCKCEKIRYYQPGLFSVIFGFACISDRGIGHNSNLEL